MNKDTVTVSEVIEVLKGFSRPDRIEGMAHYGIDTANVLGVTQPEIKATAKQIGRNHPLALELWDTGIHEARHTAAIIADPDKMTEKVINAWRNSMNSWDLVDGTVTNCFRKLPRARQYPFQWAHEEGEYQRRTAFSMIAFMAVHNKKDPDQLFLTYFPLMQQYAGDERNFVKKAINWALRSVGKRSLILNRKSVEFALALQKQESKSAKWIAGDALRELTDPKTISRIKKIM